ncbi:uncharacterized protein LOC131936766 [Physella acuta]|uniref:uncharacterized protein LOC131936766 n=1 Tax=Physella acuta TaxID=109671 RepID=UPI0027DB710D|nr:uncharacterized protein LOC131936766 [Physella acuta]
MARGVWSGSMVVCYIVFLYLFSVGYRADPDFDLDLSHYGTHFVISSALNDYNTTLGEDDVIWILQILNPTTKTARLKIEVAGTVSKMAHVGALRAQNVHVSPLMRSEQVGLTQSLVVWSTDAVSVTVINNGRSHEGLLAFPVSVFGTQYIVVTLPGNPVLQVLTSHDLTHVTIHFTDMSRDLEASDQHKFKVVYNGETYTPGSTLEVTIESKYQVFQFHDCHAHHRLRSDFTGTLITSSLPVGVISGNCVTNSNPDDDHGSHLEEMLVPISSWGYHFYIATPSAGYPTQTRIRVVSLTFGVLRLHTGPGGLHTDPGGLEDTQQVDGRTVAEELTLLYRAPTFWCQKILSGEVHAYLVSTVPIFVVMYWPDKVTGSKGHSGMIQLVPNENWLSWYYIRAPDLQNKNSFIYLSIVAMTTDVDGIRIGFNHLDSTDENTVIKELLSGFTFIARLVSSGQGHVIQHLHQHTFACYTRLVVKAGRVLYQQGMAFRNMTQVGGAHRWVGQR